MRLFSSFSTASTKSGKLLSVKQSLIIRLNWSCGAIRLLPLCTASKRDSTDVICDRKKSMSNLVSPLPSPSIVLSYFLHRIANSFLRGKRWHFTPCLLVYITQPTLKIITFVLSSPIKYKPTTTSWVYSELNKLH